MRSTWNVACLLLKGVRETVRAVDGEDGVKRPKGVRLVLYVQFAKLERDALRDTRR